MKPPKRNSIIIEIISALFILLFVYTGVSKFSEQQRFKIILSESPLIGPAAAIISVVLPLTELVIALLLFFPTTRKWGLAGSFALMIVFTLYIAYMIFFTPDRPCSCGGVIRQMSWGQHLIFNLFFTTLAASGLWLYKKNKNFIAINRGS